MRVKIHAVSKPYYIVDVSILFGPLYNHGRVIRVSVGITSES